MQHQVIFRPSAVVGADGWTETGGGTQPPNRALPAPIFDAGTQYQPNNGNTGTWIIEKTVFSNIAGPGFITIPGPVAFPNVGLFADDRITSIEVNGVAASFTGLPSGNVAPQTVPVTWLAGANTVRITVLNTVAGGTSIAGRIEVSGAGMPCDCCPSVSPECAQVEIIFDGAHTEVFTGGPGITPVGGAGSAAGLARWSDWDISGGNFTGYTSPAVQFTAATSPVLDLSFTTPQNRIRGLREYNQGGGDLSDFDGFLSWDYEVFAGATSLLTGNMTMGNGGAPFTHLFPGGVSLNGVTRVRLSNMRKLNPGATVAPLVREVQAIQTQPVFPCRQGSTVTWYSAAGDPIPVADIVDCPEGAATVASPGLRMDGFAFNDAPNEFMCNITPSPTTTSGWNVTGVCYDPTVANPTMDWVSGGSVTMEYGSAAGNSGGVIVQFSYPGIGPVTWPTDMTMMAVGAARTSNNLPNGGHAVLTYLSGPGAADPAGTIRMEGGGSVGIHRGTTSIVAPIRFRLDYVAP